jgi:protein-S-isoprenylcysteine O-methyltransferase Ste14
LLARPTAGTLLYGAMIIIIGQSIRVWSAGYIHKNEILTVTGPYSLSRNPLYVGSFVLGGGFMIAMGVFWLGVAYLIFFSILYWFTIRWEERKLKSWFPDAWEEYSRSVPRFLPLFSIPSYRSGEFNWSQVIRYRELLNASVVLMVYFLLWGKVFLTGG